MTSLYCLELNSIKIDRKTFKRSISRNPNGTMNVACTLTAICNSVLDDIENIKNTIENSKDISNLFMLKNGKIGVEFKTSINKIIDSKKIDRIDTESENETSVEENQEDSDSETNTTRLKYLRNLLDSSAVIEMNDSDSESNISYKSNSDSLNDGLISIPDNDKNISYLIEKINDSLSSESDNYNDCSEDDTPKSLTSDSSTELDDNWSSVTDTSSTSYDETTSDDN